MMKVIVVGSDGKKRYLNVPVSRQNEEKILQTIDENAGKIGAFNLLTDLLELLPKGQ
jgi:hypothetical protein